MGNLLYNKTMTKEQYQKKRKRDIALVIIFAILIVGFFVSVSLTNFYTDGQVWASFLAAFLIMLFIASIALTAVFGYKLNEDNEKLSLIHSGVAPEEVEQKYQELKEQREKEAEQEKRDKRNKRIIEQAKKLGRDYYYNKNGDAFLKPLNTTSNSKKSSSTKSSHYSVFDDHDWEHDVFNDPDIRDDDIMDFMDDDY